MLKSLVTSVAVLGLVAGCSSTGNQPNPDLAQYCYTEETVDIRNNSRVDSSTRVRCSDDPAKRAKYVGVDPATCRSYNKRVVIRGNTKEIHGFLCRDENGNFRPLDQF